MKTQYVNMSIKTQKYLLSFLALFPENINWRSQIVSVSYSESKSEYPETILNLRWSLGTKFRILSLYEKFGEEKAIEEWQALLQIKNSNEFEQKLAWFDNIANPLLVSEPDFATGVKGLYKKLTSSTVVKKDGVPAEIPMLIIRLNGYREDRHSHTFTLFIYDKRERAFVKVNLKQ